MSRFQRGDRVIVAEGATMTYGDHVPFGGGPAMVTHPADCDGDVTVTADGRFFYVAEKFLSFAPGERGQREFKFGDFVTVEQGARAADDAIVPVVGPVVGKAIVVGPMDGDGDVKVWIEDGDFYYVLPRYLTPITPEPAPRVITREELLAMANRFAMHDVPHEDAMKRLREGFEVIGVATAPEEAPIPQHIIDAVMAAGRMNVEVAYLTARAALKAAGAQW